MTRVALIGDSHYDESSRFEECCRIHNWIAEDLAARGVDLVLHSGDVFERRSTPRERAAVADWLRRVADIAPVVIVRGNHDAPGDLAIYGRLRTRHPVIVEEAAAVHVVAGVAVGCLAWPRKAELLAGLGREVPQEAAGQVAVEALQAVLRGLGAQMATHAGPRILLAHAMVRGSRVSTGQPLVGCDLEIGVDDLGFANAEAYCLGHVHCGQDWNVLRDPVIYPGSPRRTAFGEVESKGYVVLDFAPRLIGWQRVETPATPMLLIEGRLAQVEEWADSESGEPARVIQIAHRPTDEEVGGAEIRLRYEVEADHRDAGKAAAEIWRAHWLRCGAASVKVEEEVVATSKARAPEVAAAKTLPEQLAAMWRARGVEPDETRRERLLGMVATLEEEVRHAA